MTLPYDMGNAGDLLKHGVLAEFVRWQCALGLPLRFLDPFGGEPWGRPVPEVARRVRALPVGALRAAQTGIDDGRYYGSSLLVRRAAEAAGRGRIRVLGGDVCAARRDRLRACGSWMLDEAFPVPGAATSRDRYDGYAALGPIVRAAREGDLLLVDPFFDDFLERRARVVVPRLAAMARRAAAILFVLNPEPRDRNGRRFDRLLEDHLRGAWRMTCPPLPGARVRGESRRHAEVVLAARLLREPERADEAHVLLRRLTDFTRRLAGIVGAPAKRLEPRVVGG